jgi:hypothetical protein
MLGLGLLSGQQFDGGFVGLNFCFGHHFFRDAR